MDQSTLERAERQAELINKKLELLRELAAIDAEIEGGEAPKATATKKVAAKAPGKGTGKRGRPKGSKNKPADGTAPSSEDGDKTPRETLPNILVALAKEAKKPLALKDFTELVLKSGRYHSKAKNQNNIIYQGLNNLVKAGVFSKPDKEYILAKDAA